MTDSPAFLHSGDVLRSRFNRYKITERVNNPEIDSTPSHTPTVVTLRLTKSHPQLYSAKDVNGKPFAIKVVDDSSLNMLLNEWRALDKIRFFQKIPFVKQIAPRLIGGMEYDSDRKIYFIVTEWLETMNWKRLSQIVVMEPLCFQANASTRMYKLRNALFSATRLLHSIGIIHGDSKDEHVYLQERNGEILYDKVRLIDFGGCYLNMLSDWQGGSLGFSSPYFWNPKHRYSLSRREMEALDWYGVHSILFYSYTGDCFPASSPAFSNISDPASDRYALLYYQELKQTLLNKWQNHSDDVQLLIAQTVDYLCSPDALIVPKRQ